jgi:hypothetical protein
MGCERPYDLNASYDPNASDDPNAPDDPSAEYAAYDPNAQYEANAYPDHDPNVAYDSNAEWVDPSTSAPEVSPEPAPESAPTDTHPTTPASFRRNVAATKIQSAQRARVARGRVVELRAAREARL